jgi:hypothetical protein
MRLLLTGKMTIKHLWKRFLSTLQEVKIKIDAMSTVNQTRLRAAEKPLLFFAPTFAAPKSYQHRTCVSLKI